MAAVMPGASALLVSDIHLSALQPRTTAAFLQFLASVPGRAASLYILGDLFEYWAGDDDVDDAYPARILAALRAVSGAGVALYFMAGNRDFLAGPGFEAASGARILPDPYVLEFKFSASPRTVLLSHGDALCTDDLDYQTFRSQVRTQAWRKAFLAQPLAERKTVIARLRSRSEAVKRDKPAAIMDVNAVAVRRLLREQHGDVLIHGHTHRPGVEHLTVNRDGMPAHLQRWVLTDWDCDGAPMRGGGLRLGPEGMTRFGLDG